MLAAPSGEQDAAPYGYARDRRAPRGVEVRFVPTDTDAIVAACAGAKLVPAGCEDADDLLADVERALASC